jgi:hypothetical protein
MIYKKIKKEAIKKMQHNKMLKLTSKSDNKKKFKINFCRLIGRLLNQ